VRKALAGIPMFGGLSEADLQRVAAIATLRDHPRGTRLWSAGDEPAALNVIVRGRVKVVRHADAGDMILEIFGEGEPVGSIAVYNGIPYPASAVCMEPVTLLSVPRRDYFDMLDHHPGFARAIIRQLTKLTIALTRKLEDMRGQRVDVRIAQLFLTLAERMGRETQDGVEIPMGLTRQEIADLVGTTVESAIRVMSRWGHEQVVLTGEHRFVIPSLDRLRDKTADVAEG